MPRRCIRNYGASIKLNADAFGTIGDTSTHSFIQNTGVFTIIAHVKPSTNLALYFIGSTSGTGGDHGFWFGFGTATGTDFRSYGGAGIVANKTDTTIKAIPNVWQMMMLSSNGTSAYTLSQYVDGTRNETSSTFSTFAALGSGASTRATNIGALTGATGLAGFGFKGNITEILVYNRQLTQAEKDGIYFNDIIPLTGLVSRTKLDEGSGTTLNDSVAGVPAGTLSTASVWSTDAPGALRTLVSAGTARTVCPILQNKLVRSQDVGNASWTKTRATAAVTSGGGLVTGPNGAADAITEDDTAATTHLVLQASTLDLTTSRATFGVFAKAGTRSFIFLAGHGTGGIGSYFDLTNGLIGTVDTTQGVRAGMRPITGFAGWYYCWISYPVASAAVTKSATGVVFLSATGASLSYSGVSASFPNGVYLNGAQISNTDGPTAYALTTAATVDTGAPRSPILTIGNLLVWSEALATSPWSIVSATVTVTADQIANPINGAVDVDLITAASAGVTEHNLRQNVLGGAAAFGTFYQSNQIIISAYMKKSGSTQWTTLRSRSGAAIKGGLFDLTNGVVGTVSTNATSGMTSLGNGWYRCWVAFTASKTEGTSDFAVGPSPSNSLANYSQAGEAVYVWGCQMEFGNVMGDYVKTGAGANWAAPRLLAA